MYNSAVEALNTDMINITIYSKKDCHLCDIARETLLKVRQELPFSLTEIDIEGDVKAFEKYKYLIPVIEIDGEKTFNYSIDETELKKVLRMKSQPR
ncbi:MAG: glutaredoxin family protein [Candidatus Methanoperedens sp.]|nr:glutaredoxin family protein [Candidatus Methanoperedens sp.]